MQEHYWNKRQMLNLIMFQDRPEDEKKEKACIMEIN